MGRAMWSWKRNGCPCGPWVFQFRALDSVLLCTPEPAYSSCDCDTGGSGHRGLSMKSSSGRVVYWHSRASSAFSLQLQPLSHCLFPKVWLVFHRSSFQAARCLLCFTAAFSLWRGWDWNLKRFIPKVPSNLAGGNSEDLLLVCGQPPFW